MRSLGAIKSIALPIQRMFLGFDKKILKQTKESSETAPIFIVGAPRSGSTLFFQMLLQSFGFAYISNLSALTPSWNSLTIAMQRWFKKEKWTKISPSDLGYVPGLFAPNEAGKFCDFLLDNSDKTHIQNVRKTFAYYHAKFSNELLIKNLSNSIRLDKIYAVFPNAKIVFVQRDERFNAQSILDARLKMFKDKDTWFSVRPDGWKNVSDKDPYFQVVWQVKAINHKICKDAKLFGSNFITVKYEDLIDNTNGVFAELSRFFNKPIIGNNVANLNGKNKVKLSEKEWDLIQKHSKEIIL